jgi:putative Mg2+ transporter-C (MgtC) family protein
MEVLETIRRDLLPVTYLPWAVIIVRLLAALLLGAMIGLEREVRNRPAGLRTHMLVSLAAAIFAIVTIELINSDLVRPDSTRVDPVRLIEAVTAGAGFLAAGVIIQSRGAVHGVTTATALWLAAAIGLASGAGYALIAALATVLTIIVLTIVQRFERPLKEGGSPREPAKEPAATR